MNIWDSWAFQYRNARGLAAAAMMLFAILAMLSMRCNPVVDRQEVLGLVLEVEAEGLRPMGDGVPQARVILAVPDSVEIRLLLPPPVPRPGHFIPLKVELYKKGDRHYYLNHEKWRLDGPS